MNKVSSLWLDGPSILREGVSLDYCKLRQHFKKTFPCSGILDLRYYDHQMTAGESQGGKGRNKDQELYRWQWAEQQRAQDAGFVLHLSPPWAERVRCLFCSCLNAINFPAPALLDLQADILLHLTAVYLLSHTPSLLFSLGKHFGELHGKLHLLCFEENWESLHAAEWPHIAKLQAAYQPGMKLEEFEWE